MSRKCIGCDTLIPLGSRKCPMCGAPAPNNSAMVTNQPQPLPPPIVQNVTEVHHHHGSQTDKPVLIEGTGKKWKKMLLLAWLFVFTGMGSCAAALPDTPGDPPIAGLMVVAGLFWVAGIGTYISGKFGAWWHHG